MGLKAKGPVNFSWAGCWPSNPRKHERNLKKKQGPGPGIFEGILLRKSGGKPKEFLRKSDQNPRGYPGIRPPKTPPIHANLGPVFIPLPQGKPKEIQENTKEI